MGNASLRGGSTPTPAIERTVLFDRLYGSLLASAIGDAMGGPVEGLTHGQIAARWGRVDGYLPYERPPSFHGAFSQAPGTYTDDTRLRLLLCQAIIDRCGLPSRGTFGRSLIAAQQAARSELERGFWEEYAFKVIHGGEKLIFGGEPTNGAIMMNSPIGLVCPGAPDEAFSAAYELAFLPDGYAQHSAAAMAAAVAAAVTPGATVDTIVETALEALSRHRRRVEGPRWNSSPQRYEPNEHAVRTAVAIARSHDSVFDTYSDFYGELSRSPLLSEASQTLAVALGIFVAARGDLRLTVLGCVNYGRDCDSYASVAGALAGAFRGTGAIPAAWISPVIEANPEPNLAVIARGLCHVVAARLRGRSREVEAMERLMEEGDNG
jgi:ADP-ribosylglycohydrolase